MTHLDDCLRSGVPKSEWACTPCRVAGCEQRFVTESGYRSHQQRAHAGEELEATA